MEFERLLTRASSAIAFLAISGMAMGVNRLPDTASTILILISIPVGAALAFYRPVDMLALLAVSVPLQAYGAVEVFGASVTFTKLCVACLLIGWLGRVAARKRVPIDSVVWGYVAVAVALATSIVAASDFGEWAAELYRWMVTAFVFVVARAEITDRAHVNRLVLGISVGVIGVSGYAVRQVLMENGPPSFVMNGLLRAYGTFGQPNPLAAYLELSVPILAAMVVLPAVHLGQVTASRFLQGVVAVAIVGGIVTIFLTQSRGGWIGVTAAGLVLVGSLPPKVQAGIVGGALTALAGLFILGLGGVLSDRLVSVLSAGGERVNVTSQNWANEERRAHWEAALNMARARPWTGVGAGGFNDAYREYTSEWRFRVSRGHAHNGYLHMAAQAGAAGVVAFSIWIGSIFFKVMRAWRAERRFASDGRAVGGLATIVAFSVHSVVDYLNVLSLGIQLALVIAITLANISTGRESVDEGTDTS